MAAFIDWIHGTWLSQAINASSWVWPFCESVHFVGLSLLIGIAGFFDLRLMGFFKRVPIAAAKRLMPWAAFGFCLNLASGLIFLTGIPEQYAYSWVWWMKVLFLGIAGLNVVVFEKTISRSIVSLEPGIDTPALAKAIGLVSLVAWFGVLYWGRMLPFLGGAF